MNFIRKLLLVSFLFAFCSFVFAQEGNLVLLNKIISTIENQHQVSINYLDNDVAQISLIPPSKYLTLTQKISYLESKTNLIFEKISISTFSVHHKEKKFKICGFVYSKTDQLPISEASIILENGEKTTSNNNGYYEILVEQEQNYTIRSPEFNFIKIWKSPLKSGEINRVFLEEKVTEIQEVVAKKYISSGITKNKDGSYVFSPQKGGIIPGLIEPDVLQTMLHLPGIYSTDESISNINVRSGTHDQNFILWNGIKLYQTGHFFGLISAINPYLSNEIKIYKNASPAFYGEGISSVVDISTDANFSKNNKYSLGINMLNADAYSKINLSKKSFVEIAARKSFTEFFQTPTYKEYFKKAFQNTTVTNFSTQESINYITEKNFNFYDISTKYVQKIGDKNVLVLDFITVNDQLNTSQENGENDSNSPIKNTIYQRNLGASLSWKRNWNPKNSSFLIISNSQYELDSKTNNLADIYKNKTEENYVYDNSLKFENKYKINSKYSLKTGYQLNLLNTKNLNDDKSVPVFEKINENISEHAIYAEAKMNDSLSKINITAGLRTNYITQFRKIWVEPRFQFTYSFNKNLDLNILAELKSQAISQQISQQNDFFGIEKRRWVLANNTTIPVEKSRQISIGTDFYKNNWLLTLEMYYKKVSGISSTSQGFQNQFQSSKTIGSYEAKGVEFLIQKKINHFLVWSNYNFGNSKYNFPEMSPPIFTNNFQIDQVATFGIIYEKSHYKFAIGSKWHSGKPETETINNTINYANPANPTINFGIPNVNYLVDFFQTDASASYKFKTKNNFQYQFDVAFLNVFNKENEINEYYRINPTNNIIEQIKSYSLGRTINFGVRISF
jgi:hypothetical protein